MSDLHHLTQEQAAGYFWKLMDLNVVPMMIWHFNGEVMEANDAFLNLIGYSREELNQRHLNWKLLTPHEYAHVDEQCIKQLKETTYAKAYDKKYMRKDGSLVGVHLYKTVLDPASQVGIAVFMPLDKGFV